MKKHVFQMVVPPAVSVVQPQSVILNDLPPVIIVPKLAALRTLAFRAERTVATAESLIVCSQAAMGAEGFPPRRPLKRAALARARMLAVQAGQVQVPVVVEVLVPVAEVEEVGATAAEYIRQSARAT